MGEAVVHPVVLDRIRRLAAVTILMVGCRPVAAPQASPPVVKVAPPPPTANVLPRPAQETPPPVVFDEVKDATTLLVDDYEKLELRRAYLETVGPAYWTLGRAKEGTKGLSGRADSTETHEVVVAEHHPEHLRVRVAGRGVEVLLYVAQDAFAETNRGRTPLLRSSGRPFVDAGVSLPPGAKMELSEHRGGLRRAVVRTDWFSAEGALHEEALGRVFRLEAPRPENHDEWSGAFDCTVAGGTTIYAEPDGAEVARLEPASVPCTQLSEQGAWRRVLLARGGFQIRGVVRADRITLAPANFGFGGTGGSGWWGGSHMTYRYLWPGDLLLAPNDRTVVGRVTMRRLRVGDRGGAELRRVYLPLPYWSFANLRVDEATMKAAIDKEARYQARVTFEHLTSPSGHKVEDLREELDQRRDGVNRCFDAALRRSSPTSSFRYRASVSLGPSSTATVSAIGGTEAQLEKCLTTALRVTRSPGPAIARFDLRLTPDPGVGP